MFTVGKIESTFTDVFFYFNQNLPGAGHLSNYWHLHRNRGISFLFFFRFLSDTKVEKRSVKPYVVLWMQQSVVITIFFFFLCFYCVCFLSTDRILSFFLSFFLSTDSFGIASLGCKALWIFMVFFSDPGVWPLLSISEDKLHRFLIIWSRFCSRLWFLIVSLFFCCIFGLHFHSYHFVWSNLLPKYLSNCHILSHWVIRWFPGWRNRFLLISTCSLPELLISYCQNPSWRFLLNAFNSLFTKELCYP